MQVTVGECHPKKIKCMLGALQSAFRKPAFLPKGGDALRRELEHYDLCNAREEATASYR